jgi:hypothetical protein
MFLSQALLIALATVASARPRKPAPFQVTNLNTFEPTGRPEQVNIYRVGFNVTDPNDSTAAFCEARWDYSEATTGYPSDYVCGFRFHVTPSFIQLRQALWKLHVKMLIFPSLLQLANCTDASYAFKFTDYHTYYDFVLDVRHKRYVSPSHSINTLVMQTRAAANALSSKKHGKKVTRSASGLVDFSIIQCSHAASGFSVCNQREGVAFPLEVYAVSG